LNSKFCENLLRMSNFYFHFLLWSSVAMSDHSYHTSKLHPVNSSFHQIILRAGKIEQDFLLV
jgi:hypothetical protein